MLVYTGPPNTNCADRAPPAIMRKAAIFADAIAMLAELDIDSSPNGELLLDEDFLRTQGLTDEDFVQYRCDPESEPPRMMPKDLPDLRVAEEDEAVIPSSAFKNPDGSSKL